MANKEKPLISIITISLNCRDVIEKTILSVINQSYQNIEYIIVDGGSADGTLNIIKKYEGRLSKWISEKDKGISDAMNKGINLSTGDIIGIIHAGDQYHSNAFTLLVENYNMRVADIFYGDVRFCKPGSNPVVVSTDAAYLLFKMSIAHPGVFITRKTYEKLGKYDERYKLAMDYELLLKMYKNGAFFKKLPGIIADFTEDGISSRRWRKALTECLIIKNKYAQSKIEKIINYIFYSWSIIGNSLKRLKMR